MSNHAALGETGPPRSRFDTAIEWLLVALLIFLPLAFGAVHAWSEFIHIALVGAISLVFALKLVVRRDVRVVWTWAYVPAALFILLVVLQLIPLPASLVSAISPNTASMKAELLDAEVASQAPATTLTFYSLATRRELRLLLAAAAVFVVVLNVYRRPSQIKRLLTAIAVIGGAAALLALGQDLFGNNRIYWTIPTPKDVAEAGPFVCHSHYGQFMNLSLGAALGLLLVKLHESFAHGPVRLPEVIDRLRSPELRPVWSLAAVIVLGVATIFLSLTRGGMVSLLIAGAFTGLVVASRRALRGRGWMLLLIALLAFAAVLYVGFDAVYERLATLRQLDTHGRRWGIVEDLFAAFARFPLLGTGLGTHAVVYPMFDRSTITALAAHAENDYAQATEETGFLGLGLILAFVVIVWWAYAHNVRHQRFPIRSAAFGLGFGLLAILIHSFGDFGQHLPANHTLTAITCGLLISLARYGHSERRHAPAFQAVATSPLARALALLAIIAVWAWSLAGAEAAQRAEAHWRQALRLEAPLRENNWHGTNEEYAALISQAAAAADAEPGNAEYRYWLNVYRWRAISRAVDPQTGELLVTPRTLEFAQRIADELREAIPLCPTFGPAHSLLGQIEYFVLGRPAGAERVRRGYRLAPCDPAATCVAALLDANEGNYDATLPKFQRSIALGGITAPTVIDFYLARAKRTDLALTIAGDNPDLLFRIADHLQSTDADSALAAQVRLRATALLKHRAAQPDAPAPLLVSLARIHQQEGNHQAAIDCYRRAVALNYAQVDWHFALAKLLAEADRPAEAIHQARICLRLRPQMAAARKLIEQLCVLPNAESER